MGSQLTAWCNTYIHSYGGRSVSKLHSGLFIWVQSFHLGMVWSFHSGMVFSFGHGLFICVWSFHSGMVFSFRHGLFIRAWSFHSGMVFSRSAGLFRSAGLYGPRSIWCALDGPRDYLGPPDYTVRRTIADQIVRRSVQSGGPSSAHLGPYSPADSIVRRTV